MVQSLQVLSGFKFVLIADQQSFILYEIIQVLGQLHSNGLPNLNLAFS